MAKIRQFLYYLVINQGILPLPPTKNMYLIGDVGRYMAFSDSPLNLMVEPVDDDIYAYRVSSMCGMMGLPPADMTKNLNS